MSTYGEVWKQMGDNDRRILIDRVLKYRSTVDAILFVKTTMESGVDAAAVKLIENQYTYIVDNLYPANIIKGGGRRSLQNLHYTTGKERTYAHIIMDDAHKIIHINTQTQSDMDEISTKFLKYGKVLSPRSIHQDSEIFIYPLYRAYKIIGSEYPIEMN